MSKGVFLDANALVYFLDETAELHATTVSLLQNLVNDKAELYTSHHVIEEVLFIVNKLAGEPAALDITVRKISGLPGIELLEPETDLKFESRYIKLVHRAKLGVNDALLIQIMLDAGLRRICSFDTDLLKRTRHLGIQAVPSA